MKELNFDLLKSLYCIHALSGNEKRIRRFIKRWISNNVPDAEVSQDTYGNLYVTRGKSDTYPCLCAHLDQVQHIHPKDFICIESDDVIFGYSPKLRKQCGLGGDDKNGLFIALTCLADYDVLKCAFFVGEEVGCVGSSVADMDFFTDCRFCAQIDRRGNSDLVTNISSMLCSDEFLAAADPQSWGYAPCHGLMTDVDTLRGNGLTVSCVNMSCGYYEPHTDEEFTSKPDVQKCYNFVCHLIEDCTGVYTYENDCAWGGRGYYGYLDDDFCGWSADDYLEDELDMFLNSWPNASREEAFEWLQYFDESITHERFDGIYHRVTARKKKRFA